MKPSQQKSNIEEKTPKKVSDEKKIEERSFKKKDPIFKSSADTNVKETMEPPKKETLQIQMEAKPKIVSTVQKESEKNKSIQDVKSQSKEDEIKTKEEKPKEKSTGSNDDTKPASKIDETKQTESVEEDDDDEDGMKAMRKETNDTLSNMEAEFEAGRSKLAAIRARIKRAREMAAASHEDE